MTTKITTETHLNDTKPKASYPCLKKHKDGTVVMFTRAHEGLCVCSGSDRYPKTFDYEDDWSEEDFSAMSTGESVTITITQE